MKYIVLYGILFLCLGCSHRKEFYVDDFPPPKLGVPFGDFARVKLSQYHGPMIPSNFYRIVEINGKRCEDKILVTVEYYGTEDPKKNEFSAWVTEIIYSFGSGTPPPESGLELSQFPFQIQNKLLIHKLL